MTNSYPQPPVRPGREIIQPKPESRLKRATVVVGVFLGAWVLLAGVQSGFGSADEPSGPAPRYATDEMPEPGREVEPVKPTSPMKDAGEQLGQQYNGAKEGASDFWEGFSEETSVDETLSKLGSSAKEEFEKSPLAPDERRARR